MCYLNPTFSLNTSGHLKPRWSLCPWKFYNSLWYLSDDFFFPAFSVIENINFSLELFIGFSYDYDLTPQFHKLLGGQEIHLMSFYSFLFFLSGFLAFLFKYLLKLLPNALSIICSQYLLPEITGSVPPQILVECLRTVRSYFRKFLVDVNLKNGGFIIISAVDFLFLFWSQNWESQKDYWFVCCILGGCVPLKGTVEKQTFYFVKVFCSLQVLIKKKKSPNWLNLKFPSFFLLLQSLFLNLLPLK